MSKQHRFVANHYLSSKLHDYVPGGPVGLMVDFGDRPRSFRADSQHRLFYARPPAYGSGDHSLSLIPDEAQAVKVPLDSSYAVTRQHARDVLTADDTFVGAHGTWCAVGPSYMVSLLVRLNVPLSPATGYENGTGGTAILMRDDATGTVAPLPNASMGKITAAHLATTPGLAVDWPYDLACLNQWRSILVRVSPGDIALRIDEAWVTSYTGPTLTATPGGTFTLLPGCNVSIAELIVWTEWVSDDVYLDVVRRRRVKWGLPTLANPMPFAGPYGAPRRRSPARVRGGRPATP